MSSPRAFVEYLWGNSDSVIAEPDAEFLRVIPNLNFNLFCARMVESVSQNLPANPIELVLKNRLDVSRRSFDGHAESRAAVVRNRNSRKFLPGSRQQMSQVARKPLSLSAGLKWHPGPPQWPPRRCGSPRPESAWRHRDVLERGSGQLELRTASPGSSAVACRASHERCAHVPPRVLRDALLYAPIPAEAGIDRRWSAGCIPPRSSRSEKRRFHKRTALA